jgi:hypothetical protein
LILVKQASPARMSGARHATIGMTGGCVVALHRLTPDAQ